ncbi:MAG TPA: response regulator [Stellaceae bacterium]|nr:response regulator [Stellaceae bacterium]
MPRAPGRFLQGEEATRPEIAARRIRATVLLIDDDEPFLASLARLVRSLGWRTIEAEDGITGVALFREHRPDLVLVDILMPGIDGIETIVQIRQGAPGAKIVAMSGGGEIGKADCIAAAIRFGADLGLQKPFDAETLETTVEMLLHRRRRPAPLARLAGAVAGVSLPRTPALAR